MVKAVVGDEAQLKALEDTLAALPAQVGVVVGKLSASSDRALAYSLIPTPPTDSGAPACSLLRSAAAPIPNKPNKPRPDAPSSLDFDVDWLAEHARQVSRMLLGGMSVIGIYIWASEASFKATSPAVFSQVAPWHGTAGVDERLLIHISYSPRRWACRICDVGSGSLRPCDFKLPVVQAEPFKKVISKAIGHLTKEVQNAKASINGVMFSGDMDSTLEGPHNVEFLVPFKNNLPAEEGVAGLLLFSGSVSASAYLGPKESISEAISDLKLDIITSLRSRLDIILDEADDDSTTSSLENSLPQKAAQVVFHELRVPYSFPFPRRVLIPWLASTYVCDYLQQSETTEDAIERCKEVMSLEGMWNHSIIEPESASVATLGSFWDVIPGALSKAPSEPGLKEIHSAQNGSRKTNGSNFSILAALVVLLIALLVGFIFTLSATLKT
uniref:Protein odr-4 homolog n=1 Tax=Leersia perrieri TaxID=77586 RepID=A0A0D9X3D2_9ORYZ